MRTAQSIPEENGGGSLLEGWHPLLHDVIIVTRSNGIVVSWGGAAERVLGYAARHMRGRSLFELTPPERASELADVLQRVQADATLEGTDIALQAKDGRIVELKVDTSRQGPAGDHARVLFVAQDITAQRRAETALLTSERRWRSLIDSAVDGIIVIDSHGIIEVFNASAERMFGYVEQEMLGQNIKTLMPAPYSAGHDGYIADYLRTGRKKIIGIGREVVGLRRDGSTFPMRLSVGEMRVGFDHHFTGILHDLTPTLELEARLREQTAMARLGEMAAVIAHEVKNPLAAVRGAIQVIGGRLPSDSKDKPVITEIVSRIDALDSLIKDLLLFARAPQPRMSAVDLESLMRVTSAFLADDPMLATLNIVISSSAGPVQGDAELLNIVFQNLLINAAQAVEGRGTVTVRISGDEQWVRVDIADAGPGMNPEVRRNLFRPFFTTKARGTGLGLPTAKRLVELHGGSIAVDSTVGVGSTVTVLLPVGGGIPARTVPL
jgi:two-component system, LuxR family, sensor kinase FixL